MQITVPIEKLGMYGQDPVPFSSVYVGTGDCGLVLTGGTIGGTIIAGGLLERGAVLCHPAVRHLSCLRPRFFRCKLNDKACCPWLLA